MADLCEETASDAMRQAANRFGNALNVWYPQGEKNAPSERNLTLHLAHYLAEATQDMHLWQEAHFKCADNKNRRIDLIAYQPSKSILLVEAKRFLEKHPQQMVDDIARMKRFHEDCREQNRVIAADRKLHMLVTQSIEESSKEWWMGEQQSLRRKWSDSFSTLGEKLRAIREIEGSVFGFHVDKDNYRFTLWCVWNHTPGSDV